MIKKILPFIIATVCITQCRSPRTDAILISNLNNTRKLPVLLEIDPDDFENDSDALIAKSVDNPGESFVLQKGRSLFYSSGGEGKNTFCTILSPSITEGKFKLSHDSVPEAFTLTENENGQLLVSEKGNPVLKYNFGMQLKEGVSERYRRSSYIHPIYDTEGNILTDDFPSDHYHHRGLSWMWPKVFINGKRYDLWHIYGQDGKLDGLHQVFDHWLIKETGPVFAIFGAKNTWQLDDGTEVMDEWVYVRVFRAEGGIRAIDMQLNWQAKTSLTLEGQDQKGYGGFNFRFAQRTDTQITSPFGKEKDSDLKAMPWADQSAKFDRNEYFSGVGIFQHKRNRDFPAGWCLRHYGFLGVAWPGVKPYEMNPGDQLSLRFRIWIHRGNAEEGSVESAYAIFNNPPNIRSIDISMSQ